MYIRDRQDLERVVRKVLQELYNDGWCVPVIEHPEHGLSTLFEENCSLDLTEPFDHDEKVCAAIVGLAMANYRDYAEYLARQAVVLSHPDLVDDLYNRAFEYWAPRIRS